MWGSVEFGTRWTLKARPNRPSPYDVESEGELGIACRFKSTGGDYWQLDSIWQPIHLDLKSSAAQELWLPILTPAEVGG